jgi:hypothetical protein
MIEAEFQDRRANHEQQLTPEEFEQALEELAEYSDKISDPPLEAFSRRAIYRDHD